MTDSMEFLSQIWPPNSIYCLATPIKLSNGNTAFRHRTVKSISAAAKLAKEMQELQDVYFAIHTLKEERIWNPNKRNARTGEMGAYQVRVHANMAESRAFFFDLDVGEGEGKYPSQLQAIEGLREFCKSVHMPKPTVVSSGYGVHVYWIMHAAMPSSEWRAHAAILRKIAEAEGLKIDPSRTTDVSSILRVPGTTNHKGGKTAPVMVLQQGAPLFRKELLEVIRIAAIRADITEQPDGFLAGSAPQNLLAKDNTTEMPTYTPPALDAVEKSCAQLRALTATKGDCSEPQWYYGLLNLVRFCENGEELVHTVSEGHPNYCAEATNEKVHQLESQDIGPTTCQKMAEISGRDGCDGCPFFGKVKSPLVAARLLDERPAPKVSTPEVGEIEVELPPPPAQYTRTKDKGITLKEQSADGEEIVRTIHDYDVYPIRRVMDDSVENHPETNTIWASVDSRDKVNTFAVSSEDLADNKRLSVKLMNADSWPDPENQSEMRKYMSAYIRRLEKHAAAEETCLHLGWNKDYTGFALPDKLLVPGSAKFVTLNQAAATTAELVYRKGTLQGQVEALKFLNKRKYRLHQFYICCGLATVLVHMTGHHGAIINADGESGVGKSTLLYAAAGLWGNPTSFTIPGTDTGSSLKGRLNRLTTLSSLPVCIDEITTMTPEQAQEMALQATQPTGGVFLGRNRVERRETDVARGTLMLTTGNKSLPDMLSANTQSGTAGAMRVIELELKLPDEYSKIEADVFLRAIKENFGHIGPAFARYIVDNYEEVKREVLEMLVTVDQNAKVRPEERFWSFVCGLAVKSCQIANRIGLLEYNSVDMLQLCVDEVIPSQREMVRDMYQTDENIVASFIREHFHQILVVEESRVGGRKSLQVVREPSGARGLVGEWNRTYSELTIVRKAFDDYCRRRVNRSGTLVRKSLSKGADPLLTDERRSQIGAGTDFAVGRERCIILNADHESIGSRPHLVALKENQPITG